MFDFLKRKPAPTIVKSPIPEDITDGYTDKEVREAVNFSFSFVRCFPNTAQECEEVRVWIKNTRAQYGKHPSFRIRDAAWKLCDWFETNVIQAEENLEENRIRQQRVQELRKKIETTL